MRLFASIATSIATTRIFSPRNNYAVTTALSSYSRMDISPTQYWNIMLVMAAKNIRINNKIGCPAKEQPIIFPRNCIRRGFSRLTKSEKPQFTKA